MASWLKDRINGVTGGADCMIEIVDEMRINLQMRALAQ
jgi:hypothetical protein